MEDEARAWFTKLENGDEEAKALWQWFRDESLKEFARVYDLLDIEFDSYAGESFHSDKMDVVIEKIKDVTRKYQNGALGIYTMRPAIYMYASIIAIIVLVVIKKNKKLILIILPSLYNTLSLIPSMPVPSTRYVYITFLTFWILVPWCVYEIVKVIKNKRKSHGSMFN